MPPRASVRRLVAICATKVLPLLEGDLLALIEIAAEPLLPQGCSLPVSKRRIKAKQRKAALGALRDGFDWSRVDAEILGHLYESLLEVEGDKTKQGPRRKSGIFYTPSYITEFLVKAAIESCGSGLKNEPPRVLDPACGGGAFLIAAFRELCRRYPKLEPRKIATTCLHGIDSDENAVHVARLSIWLEAGLEKKEWKVLEKRIRQGDSLRDSVRGQQERFEIVVGNPPYRNVKRGIPEDMRDFCKSHYRSATGQWDLAAPFVEMTLEHLLEPDGSCAFILPSPVLLAQSYQTIREIILEHDPVAFGPAGTPFSNPSVEASLIVVRWGKPGLRMVSVLDGRSGDSVRTVRIIPNSLIRRLPFKVFSHLADRQFLGGVFESSDSGHLAPLGQFVSFTRGIECGKRDPRVVHTILSSGKPGRTSRPLIVGEAVSPFFARPTCRFRSPEGGNHDKILKNPALWEGEKQLLLRRVADRPIAAVATPPSLVLNTIYIVKCTAIDEYSTCALLNSGNYQAIFRQLFAFDDRLFPYLRVSQLAATPIPPEALADPKLAEWSVELHEIATENSGLPDDGHVRKLLGRIDRRVESMYGCGEPTS